jgi:hypothetical protein
MAERQGGSPWILHSRFSRSDGVDGRLIANGPTTSKAGTVSESLRAGVTVNEVAERHGLKANHLSS